MGMFDSVPGVRIGGVWDERRFVGFDFPHCASMIHPDARPEQLDLSCDWLAWGTYGDDYYPLVFGSSRDLAAARLCNERLTAFMPLDAGTTPEPVNPIERGLGDLWQRTAAPMPAPARAQFRQAVQDMVDSWLWELANEAQQRIPDPVDYIEMRRKTFGADMTMSLAWLAHADVIDPQVRQSRVLRELDTAAQDYACCTNDLFSYQKEIEFEGELHNLVLVVQNFLAVGRMAARDVVADLMTARMRQFEHIIAVDLPALFDEYDLATPVRAVLTRHADSLKDWMSGILEWHRRCARYTEAELRHTGVRATRSTAHPPTGLGTGAARIAAPGALTALR
jgi:germacradienol/geosmin synthase